MALFLIVLSTLSCVCAQDNSTQEFVSVESDNNDLSQNENLEVEQSTKNDVKSEVKVDAFQNGSYIYGYNINEGNDELYCSFSDAKSKPKITIDGEEYTSKISSNTFFTLDVSKLSIGDHTIDVTYSNGKTTKHISKNINIKPAILSYKGSLDYYCYYKSTGINFGEGLNYGDGTSLTLKLPGDAKGSLLVYVSKANTNIDNPANLYKSQVLADGFAKVLIDDLKLGNYYVFAKYNGSDYAVENQLSKLTVRYGISYPYSMTYGDDKYLTIMSDKSDTSTFTVKVNDKKYGQIKMVNGVGRISLKKLPISEEVSVMVYKGSKMVYFDQYEGEFYITVNPKKARLTGGKDITMYYGASKKYSIKVYGGYGKVVGKGQTVKIKVGTKTYNVKTSMYGYAILKIDNGPGVYKISATYKGVTVTNKLTVKQVLTLKDVNVKKSARKLVLTATLKHAKKALKSKKVTFKFNGKKYTAKTNAKGVAKVKIPKSALKGLAAGKTVKYSVSYGKAILSKKATVKR